MDVEKDFHHLLSTTRKVYLKTWFNVDKKKPRKGQKVWICDAQKDLFHKYGWADYQLPATFDGKNYMMDNFGPVEGMTYWKPR